MSPKNPPVLPDLSAHLRNIDMLQKHFPQVLEVDAKGRYRINASLLQLAVDPAGLQVEEDGYELRWVGKREAYHSAFLPVQKILQPLPLPKDSQNWESTNNLLLRGDNLDALRLLRHSYFGKVKLIYIDPPYNTQNDGFIYRDNFSANQSQILEQLGYAAENIDYIKNIYGAKTHSGWLSFMYPRLLLAKDLLRDDGVIFISIDDNEQAQLKLLCDEVFGQDNFVSELTVLCNPKGRSQDKHFATNHEYLLAYSKTALPKGHFSIEKDDSQIEAEYTEEDADGERFRSLELRNTHREFGRHNRENLYYPFFVNATGEVSLKPGNGEKVLPIWEDGFQGCWTWGKTKAEEEADFLVARRVGERWKIYRKSYANGAERMLKTILSDKSFFTERGQKEFNTLFSTKAKLFQSPKSPFLITELCRSVTSGQDLILDFFAGSGTTGEAVMRLNAEDGGSRQCILVQIPQPIDPKKQKEAHTFVTETLGKPATIFEITAERLRRAGAKLQAELAAKTAALGTLLATEATPLDTGFRVFDLVDDPDALMLGKPLAQATQDDLAFFAKPHAQSTEQVLYNLLLAEGLPLTTKLEHLIDGVLVLATDPSGSVALVLRALPLDVLTDTLTRLKTEGRPALHLTVYAPWMRDDNFMQGIKTVAESLGYSSDKLRLRG